MCFLKGKSATQSGVGRKNTKHWAKWAKFEFHKNKESAFSRSIARAVLGTSVFMQRNDLLFI